MNNTANLTSHQDLWRNMTAANTTWVHRPVEDPVIGSVISVVVIVIVFITMVSLGCTMEVSKIKYHLMKPKGVAIAVVAQYVIMPLTAFCLAKVGIIIMLIFTVVTLILTAIGIGHYVLTVLSPSLLAIAGLMPLIGYCFGYVFSAIFRLSHREGRTVSMETGCQNVPLCTTILKVAFPDEVVGPLYLFPTVYMVFQLLEAAMIIMLFWCYQRFKRKEKETYQAAATRVDLKESDV